MKEDFNKVDFDVGSLIVFKDLKDNEVDLLIKLLSDENSYLFQVLFNVIGINDTLKLIDIFSDNKIIFPPRKRIYKLIEKIKIYEYIKSKNESEEAYKLLSKQYNKRISQLKSIVERIDYLLENKNLKEETK
jgi:hypothetical protein